MKTIFKYEIDTFGQSIFMLKGAEILTIQPQYDRICIWAMVDPNAPKERRHFEVYGTGHEIDEGDSIKREYIGTCQVRGGKLVWHVFERFAPPKPSE